MRRCSKCVVIIHLLSKIQIIRGMNAMKPKILTITLASVGLIATLAFKPAMATESCSLQSNYQNSYQSEGYLKVRRGGDRHRGGHRRGGHHRSDSNHHRSRGDHHRSDDNHHRSRGDHHQSDGNHHRSRGDHHRGERHHSRGQHHA